jgi:peptide/nickel transport system substrate-binding protein
MLQSIKTVKKLLWVALALIVVLTAVATVGCGDKEEATTTTAPTTATTVGPGTTAAPSTTAPTTATTVAKPQPMFRLGAIAGAASFDSLNPYISVTAAALSMYMQMYPRLTQFSEPDLEPRPDLALSWETTPDGKTMTFKLRDDAVWSDGKPITANDAAFAINTAVKFSLGAAANQSPFVTGIESATAVDATTLVVTLTGPQPSVLANLVNLSIVPEHIWGPLAAGDGAQLKTLTNDPSKETVVVAGPFVIDTYDPKGTTIFKTVDTYYGPKPLIPGFGIQLFTSADAAVQALTSGQIDAIFPVSAPIAKTLSDNPNIEVGGTGKMPLTLAINNHPEYPKAELRDVKVREAIDISIDRQAIVDNVFQGFAEAGGSHVYPEFAPRFMSTPLSVPERDVARANAILDEAGYAKGPDGIRMTADGRRMEYKVIVWSVLAGDYQRIFDILKANLAEIGIALVPEMADNAWNAFIETTPKKYSADSWLVGFVENADVDSGLVMFSSSMTEAAISFTGTMDPELDAAIAKEMSELDPVKRKAAVDESIALLQSKHVEIPLVYWRVLIAWDKRWQNVEDLTSLFATPTYLSRDGYVRVQFQE